MLKHTVGRVALATAMTAGTIGGGAIWASTEPPVDPTTAPPSVDPSAAPTTVSSSASPTAASAAPSTTVDPAVALAAAISDGAVQAAAAGRAALFHPGDPAAVATLDQSYVAGSPARARIDRLVQEHSGAARVLRPHPTIADAAIVEDVIAGAGASPNRAGVVMCLVEASEEVSPSGEVLAQDIASRREVFEMNLVDGHWQLLTSSNLQTWSSEPECAPPTPEVTQAAQITVRISEIDAVRWSAIVNIDAADPNPALSSVLTESGQAMTGTQGFIQHLRDSGERVRIESGRPTAVLIERLDVVDGPPATRIDAVICGVDATVMYEPGGGPDGQDAVVNDIVSTNRVALHLAVEDGTWQLDSVEALGRWTGAVECPAN